MIEGSFKNSSLYGAGVGPYKHNISNQRNQPNQLLGLVGNNQSRENTTQITNGSDEAMKYYANPNQTKKKLPQGQKFVLNGTTNKNGSATFYRNNILNNDVS